MTQLNPLNTLGLKQALQAIENHECTAPEIIAACYDRIEAREPEVGAWQYNLTREQYLQLYCSNQAFYEQSPLKGLPVGIKDIIDTADMPTEMGSPIHEGRQPVDDASCVALIRQAGGIVLGKTVTTEFAYFKPGKTANPRDLSRTPGGSSSGSAAAVADAMVPVSLGSQTAASVIRPAAYCGAVGYVGTRGTFSLRGVQPLAQSLDSLGLMARRVEDVALMRALLLRDSNPLEAAQMTRPKRVLLALGERIGETDSAMQEALAGLVQRMQEQGVEVVELGQGVRLDEMVAHHQSIMSYEVARNLAIESANPELLSEPLSELIENGLNLSREAYLRSLAIADATAESLWQPHQDADVILAPAAPGVAPEGHGKTGAPHMSRPWQAMGLPVVNVPGLEDEQGLPLGVQLIGRRQSDDTLLGYAGWLEKLMGSAA
ncbi:amidase [Marinobacterium stanieri]|uniref:Asp-tRNAAsn/Glu-tRNAGln amidotransferase A subunit n=1 Tax=Marinobacterium stanieri TaxID=49186 RepID=A0A1N6SEK1_9GAMM|nr:amidase [Marinobacterium stanieri]SIQ39470.1 Asp-tRNAAsn/Glu-tRNAGln amidotransferase A subunit [Marinobacterium stanieri]